MYSTYSAHVRGKSHGVSPLCAEAGGAFSRGLEAAALLAFRGSQHQGRGLPTLPRQEGIGENQGRYTSIFGSVAVSLLQGALEGQE